MFKTGKGKYIAPAVIENKLLVHPDIEHVCVSGCGFPQPHALICPTPAARKRISDSVWLTVWEGADWAQAFYLEYGFKQVGTCTFLLGSDPQTDFVMSKEMDIA